MTFAAKDTQRIVVDNIMVASSTMTVFSGPNQDGRRVRVVISEGLSPVEGEAYEVTGEWRKKEKVKNELYAMELHAESHKRIRLSGKLVVPFLQSRLTGIGPERAKRLSGAFGDNLDEVLEDDSRIIDVAKVLNKKGEATDFSIRLAVMAHEQWGNSKAEYKTLRWLEKHGVENPSTGRLVAKILGESAPEILEENPYILSATLSWHRMDQVGLPILRANPSVESAYRAPERLVGAADNVMRDIIAKGHTAIKKEDFNIRITKKLRQNEQVVDEAIRLAVINSAVIDCDTHWRAPGCSYMEEAITSRFKQMMSGAECSDLKSLETRKIKLVLNNMMVRNGMRLHVDQEAAVIKAMESQLMVLTGGAGTGKTTVVKNIADTWEHMGGRVELAALSGKAALRMHESTGRFARTIFRFLKGLEKRAKGDKSQDLPMLDDKTLLIIDEASMVDLGQWHQIVEAMPEGCRLLMVGDVAQLPPIGFGLVFHILAKNPAVTCNLTKIQRQTDSSGIPKVSAAIRDKEIPAFRDYDGISPGVSFINVDTSRVPKEVARVAGELGGFWDNDDLMVCTALNETEVGVFGINEMFSMKNLNRVRKFDAGIEPVKGFLGNYYLPGDPIIFLRNDYKEGLFNGSMGRVKEVNVAERQVTADFDGEEKEFSGAELYDLRLAYAITCHKAQGSQAKRVIIPVTETDLMDPTWLYTAVTRAEEQCVIIGEVALLEQALVRKPAFEKRVVGFNFAT